MSQVIQVIACLFEINFSPYFNGEKTESKKTNHSTRRILRMVLDAPGLEQISRSPSITVLLKLHCKDH